jgi:surface protein
MTRMFNYAYNFNSDISTWDVSSVVDMSYMFYNAQNVNKSLSAWNVLSVIDMKYMFYNAYKFSGDVSMWRGVAASNLQTGMFSFANTFQSAFNCTDLVKGPPNSCVSN